MALVTDQNHDSQKWEVLYRFADTTVRMNDLMVIFNRFSHKCLDVPALSPNAGIGIQQFTYNGGANQLWGAETSSPTRLRPAHTPGMALDVNDPFGTSPTTNPADLATRYKVVQNPLPLDTLGMPVYTPSQFWDIAAISAAGGDFRISTRAFAVPGELVLDVVGGTRSDGGAIQVFSSHGGPNQIWEIWVSELFPG